MKNKLKLFIITILLVIGLSSCGSDIQSVEDVYDDNAYSMFIMIENGVDYTIVYHKDTKVMYAISGGYYNKGTFTVMLDVDGKPMLWEK